MGKKYPIDKWSVAHGYNRPGLKVCAGCGKAIEKKDLITVLDKQVSYFRGDDEVKAWHYQCKPILAGKV